jgi:hypothetical protein
VKIKYSAVVDGHFYTKTLATDEQAECHLFWQMRKVYTCLYGVSFHRDNPTTCGEQCGRGGDKGPYEDEEILKIVVIQKRTNIHPAAWTEELDHEGSDLDNEDLMIPNPFETSNWS